MEKARRKHPRFKAWLESGAGIEFLAQVEESLGSQRRYHATGYDRKARAHHFSMAGSLGEGELIELDPHVDAGWRVWQVTFLQKRFALDGQGMFSLTATLHREDGAPPDRAALDDLDQLESYFIYDQLRLPAEFDDGEAVRTLFPCAACHKVAGGLVHVPAGVPIEGLHPEEDEPHLVRVGVLYDGAVRFYSDEDELYLRTARMAIQEQDPRLVALLKADWAPFWCSGCEATYCADHWWGEPRACPEGHVVRAWL